MLLLLDNAPSHPPDLKLSNVKLVFLLPNTTSKLQPLDQGVIQNVKQLYKKRLLRQKLAKLNIGSVTSADQISKEITVLVAIQWISAAVNDIKPETVLTGFRKSEISEAVVNGDESVSVNDDAAAGDDDDDDDVPMECS